MNNQPARDVLICFAVRNEAKHFRAPAIPPTKTLITGIGQKNARRSILEALAVNQPRLVLTCGYAGGLNPQLKHGTVIFDCDPNTHLDAALQQVGAQSGKFHCTDRIATTTAMKRELWEQTRADAVEMESGVIREVCRTRGIHAATIRVISDDAATDLPLDFNQLSRTDGNISYTKLAMALIRSPGAMRGLVRFQQELDECSHRLAETLDALLGVLKQETQVVP